MSGKLYLTEDGVLDEAVTLDEEADRFRRFNLVEVFGEVGDTQRVGWGVHDRMGRRSVMMFDTKQAAEAALEAAQRGDDG